MDVDQIIAKVDAKARGRTRFPGQEPYWDEILVAEIKRLRAATPPPAESPAGLHLPWKPGLYPESIMDSTNHVVLRIPVALRDDDHLLDTNLIRETVISAVNASSAPGRVERLEAIYADANAVLEKIAYLETEPDPEERYIDCSIMQAAALEYIKRRDKAIAAQERGEGADHA